MLQVQVQVQVLDNAEEGTRLGMLRHLTSHIALRAARSIDPSIHKSHKSTECMHFQDLYCVPVRFGTCVKVARVSLMNDVHCVAHEFVDSV